jgi:hypothetical protein
MGRLRSAALQTPEESHVMPPGQQVHRCARHN